MITIPELAANALGTFLSNYMEHRFGSKKARLVELVPSIARIALHRQQRRALPGHGN
jgi:hypothetical protein